MREIRIPYNRPLAKERSTKSEVTFWDENDLHFPGTSKESKSTLHPPYTPRLFNRRPLAPPSSNCADV